MKLKYRLPSPHRINPEGGGGGKQLNPTSLKLKDDANQRGGVFFANKMN